MSLFMVDIIKGDGKKKPEHERVSRTFVRKPTQRSSTPRHWAMYFNLMDGSWMKVDLIQSGYRVIYNASTDRVLNDDGVEDYYEPTNENAKLNGGNNLTRGRVLSALLVAKMEHDKWVGYGEDKFDCQDFAERMVTALGLELSKSVKYT